MVRILLLSSALLLGAWSHGTPLVSTPIVSVTIGSAAEPVSNQIQADTLHNCVSSDNVTYVTSDDTHTWGNGGGANMMIGKFTSESPLTGTNVNTLSNFGGFASVASDGLSAKLAGIFCLGGNIYMTYGRQFNTGSPSWPGSNPAGVFTQTAGSIIKSTDHGATWSNFQAPGTTNANGAVPSPLSSTMFASSTAFASAGFVEYGADGSPFPPLDNAQSYVYIIGTDTNWDNGSNLYLARIAQTDLPNLTNVQYYQGGDGTVSSNWSTTYPSTPILTASGQISFPSMQFLPQINRYILLEWYYPSPSTTSSTTWNIYEAQHPWGPFTQIGTQNWTTQGFYNPSVVQRSVQGSSNNGTPLTIIFSGNYGTCCGSGGYYHMFAATLQYNTH